jgi:hypothetical protein
MNLTADTITVDKVEAIFHALSEATEKTRRVMHQSQDGDIQPLLAAGRINQILENLQSTLGRID